ncbi:hypothetical protein WA171_007022 [Blastocystis sp. BT1]
MSNVVLTYFPMPARAEGIKLALDLAGIPFTFKSVQNWPEEKAEGLKSGLLPFGLITEQEYQSVSSHDDLCHIRFNHMYRFNMIGMEGRNKGGLMNLVSEGYPTLSLIALSINNLRFVPPQSNQHFIGVLNEPSVMGVVKGYDSQSQHPYWLVDVSIIPCEPIQLRLPMTSSETNANYGGIAGYAFGIEPLHLFVHNHSQQFQSFHYSHSFTSPSKQK